MGQSCAVGNCELVLYIAQPAVAPCCWDSYKKPTEDVVEKYPGLDLDETCDNPEEAY